MLPKKIIMPELFSSSSSSSSHTHIAPNHGPIFTALTPEDPSNFASQLAGNNEGDRRALFPHDTIHDKMNAAKTEVKRQIYFQAQLKSQAMAEITKEINLHSTERANLIIGMLNEIIVPALQSQGLDIPSAAADTPIDNASISNKISLILFHFVSDNHVANFNRIGIKKLLQDIKKQGTVADAEYQNNSSSKNEVNFNALQFSTACTQHKLWHKALTRLSKLSKKIDNLKKHQRDDGYINKKIKNITHKLRKEKYITFAELWEKIKPAPMSDSDEISPAELDHIEAKGKSPRCDPRISPAALDQIEAKGKSPPDHRISQAELDQIEAKGKSPRDPRISPAALDQIEAKSKSPPDHRISQAALDQSYFLLSLFGIPMYRPEAQTEAEKFIYTLVNLYTQIFNYPNIALTNDNDVHSHNDVDSHSDSNSDSDSDSDVDHSFTQKQDDSLAKKQEAQILIIDQCQTLINIKNLGDYQKNEIYFSPKFLSTLKKHLGTDTGDEQLARFIINCIYQCVVNTPIFSNNQYYAIFHAFITDIANKLPPEDPDKVNLRPIKPVSSEKKKSVQSAKIDPKNIHWVANPLHINNQPNSPRSHQIFSHSAPSILEQYGLSSEQSSSSSSSSISPLCSPRKESKIPLLFFSPTKKNTSTSTPRHDTELSPPNSSREQSRSHHFAPNEKSPKHLISVVLPDPHPQKHFFSPRKKEHNTDETTKQLSPSKN